MFQFPERMEIGNGDIIQQIGSQDLWRVYETSDEIVAGEFIHFEAFVRKVDGKGELISGQNIGQYMGALMRRNRSIASGPSEEIRRLQASLSTCQGQVQTIKVGNLHKICKF